MPLPEPEQVMLHKAAEDARLAQKLAGDASVSDEHMGFFCQQAVEKAMKCVLTRRGIEHRRTHDLDELIGLLRAQRVDLSDLLLSSGVLTPFAVMFRYDHLPPEPEAQEEFDRDRAVRMAAEAVAWATRMTGL